MIEASTNDANTRPGPYPLADRANLFGTFLVQFHGGETQRKQADGFWGMMSVVYPRARKDPIFMQLYQALIADRYSDEDELLKNMKRLAMEATRIMDEMGTWDYPGLKRSSQE